ncbi:MAG: type IV secretion system DNA-binding domain-containing protein [Patescibacteria group bacterium]
MSHDAHDEPVAHAPEASGPFAYDHEKHVAYFAQTNFRNAMRKFGIKTDDRRRHMYVIGKTGMGKSTLLENMFLSDVYAGHGCCYIDPHGDGAEKLLDFIPAWRINDVVYFNPADFDNPIGFNVLEVNHELPHDLLVEEKERISSSLLSVFKKIWENVWSARMEYIMNNTVKALLDTPGTTLLGINRMLSDKDYRLEIVRNVKDPIVKQFWVQEFAAYDAKFASEAVAPIQNKVGQFISSAVIRNIVAQAKSSLNLREVMDGEKIFIVNLSKGRNGDEAMRLLGGMLITKIQIAAMERIDTPEKLRKDFYLYVDEFQNFAVDSFANILSEARKYRLNLILAHQYIAQLSEPVRDAVFGNVGTIVSFRVGSPDALYLEPEFMPRFLAQDIIELPRAGVYIKLMIDGVTSQPFSAATLPPIAQSTGSTQKVIEQSRERYSGNRKMIEDRVMAWSGFGDGVDIDVKMKEVSDAKKEAKKAKYSFAYTCTRCGKEFTLPIELDKSRPLYCEECKVIVDAERQKGKARSEVKKAGGSVQYAAPVKVGDGVIIPHPVAESVPLATLQNSPVSASVQHAHPVRESLVMGIEGEKKKRKRKRKKKPGDQTGGYVSAPVSLPRPSLPDDDSPIVL